MIVAGSPSITMSDHQGGAQLMGRVEGKVAIVTGGASGLGRASALALAREGASLLVTDLDAEGGEETVRRIRAAGGGALFLAHDVGEEADWEQAIAAVRRDFGRLDVLVNNAGIGAASPLTDTSIAEWRQLMRVNLDGVFLGVKHGVMAMRAEAAGPNETGGGSIVNISSILGLVGAPETVAYSASKGGVRLMTKAAAIECAAKGWKVRINSIHPGYVWTPMVEAGIKRRAQRANTAESAIHDYLLAQHPIGRLGRPEDIANGVVYLASDESAFMTGAELVIDGGYTAR
jgi:3(or 17)beta-hydroxysteroid dehydrogenase